MQPSDGYSTATNVFPASGVSMEGGNVVVMAVTSSSIRIRVTLKSHDYGFDDATFRIGFRFYTSRLLVGSCSSVSVNSLRYGGSSYCQFGGSCSSDCYNGDRMFAATFYNYRTTYNYHGWPYWYTNDWYDFTFTFATNSVTQDSSNNANQIFAQATMVYEFTHYHSNDCGKCDCSNYCWSTCDKMCYDWFTDSDYVCGTQNCAPQYCCGCYSCRWLYGWDYRVLTNQNLDGWSQAPTALANNIAVGMISKQYNV